jgi:uncharacterized protein (UPF0332 family)
MTTETQYSSAATQLLQQARQELARGDVRQASEKGWGAAAQAVKAVAEGRGWEHKNHAALFRAVDRLAREKRNDKLNALFVAANGLHMNFYENWMPLGTVRVGVDEVAQFVALLAEVK